MHDVQVTNQGERDWMRLGRLLIARRMELGFTSRAAFARHHGLSHTRTVDDMENARRANYEPATIIQVEQLYGWESGSIDAVLAGGDPVVREDFLVITPTSGRMTQIARQRRTRREKAETDDAPSDDADIQLVMDSDLPDDEKHRLVRDLLQERVEERQRRVEWAQRYIELYRRAQGE